MADDKGEPRPPLPLTRSDWVVLAASLWPLLVLAVNLADTRSWGDILGALCGFFIFGVLSLCILAVWWQERRRTLAFARVSRELGLSFSHAVSREALDPFADLPLFRLTEHPCGRIASHRMEGIFEGVRVILMEFVYGGRFRGDSRHLTGSGRQTVVILPHAGRLPDFALRPRQSVWNDLDQLWSRPTGARSHDPGGAFSSVYALGGPDPEALDRFFTSEKLAYFAGSPGWTVESWGGDILVYREGVVHKPEECVWLLLKALDIQAVLSQTAPRDFFTRRWRDGSIIPACDHISYGRP